MVKVYARDSTKKIAEACRQHFAECKMHSLETLQAVRSNFLQFHVLPRHHFNNFDVNARAGADGVRYERTPCWYVMVSPRYSQDPPCRFNPCSQCAGTGIALFEWCSKLSHSCSPNTVFRFVDGRGSQYALRAIKTGMRSSHSLLCHLH